MLKKIAGIIVAFIIMSISITGKTQSGIVAAGNTVTGSGGSISYSVGQIDFVALDNNTNGGVQQVYYSTVFPLTWLSFSVEKQGSIALVKWQTASEINTKNFVVERSINSKDFGAIGTVSAIGRSTGTSQYLLEDKNPNNGMNFYRVKQVDKNEKFIYSAIAAVNFELNISISCYPNPVKSVLNLQVSGGNRKYSYQLISINGKLLSQSLIINRITTIPVNQLKAGSYILKVSDNEGSITSFIVIKD